jgi:Ca-activated chloride channel homolog
MKKNLLTLFAIAAALAVTISSCKKDDEDPEPYSNLLDTKTTELKVTIPRIEKSQTQDKGILVYVSVTDQDGEALAEFNQHNFKMSYLCEGADTVKIESITITPLDQKRGDIAAGITMDYSGSMSYSDIANMENAVKQFVRLKESNDYLQLIKFASSVRVMNDFSNDTTVLIEAVDESASIGYMTAYFDAVYTGLENADTFTMQQTNMLPAVLAFTDGYENSSYTSLGELIDKSLSTQIPVYTVGFGNVDEATMITLADTTGGRYFYTPTSDEVEELYNTISGQLRNIYSLSWQYVTITCDEITITVRVSYENANGLLTAVSSRSFRL